MMQAGGNDALNRFLAVRMRASAAILLPLHCAVACGVSDPLLPRAWDTCYCHVWIKLSPRQQYAIPKDTDPRRKYNSKGAAIYRDKIKAAVEGRPWTAPPVRSGLSL